MKTTINVTRKHINDGIRGDCNRCAVALAVLDLPGVCVAEVDGDIIRAHPERGAMVAAGTPDEVVEFIERFDCDGIVDPFTFEVEFEERVV